MLFVLITFVSLLVYAISRAIPDSSNLSLFFADKTKNPKVFWVSFTSLSVCVLSLLLGVYFQNESINAIEEVVQIIPEEQLGKYFMEDGIIQIHRQDESVERYSVDRIAFTVSDKKELHIIHDERDDRYAWCLIPPLRNLKEVVLYVPQEVLNNDNNFVQQNIDG